MFQMILLAYQNEVVGCTDVCRMEAKFIWGIKFIILWFVLQVLVPTHVLLWISLVWFHST
jgi:hypothetical protein